MKSEILVDGGALHARVALASPRTALMGTTHHLRLIVGRARGVVGRARGVVGPARAVVGRRPRAVVGPARAVVGRARGVMAGVVETLRAIPNGICRHFPLEHVLWSS